MLLYAGISLLCFLVALIAWRWAKRGKRVDRHPICRKCGYDMFGRDLAELPDCPECGTQIYSHKQLRLGNREPRVVTSRAALSLALLALVASMGCTAKWAQTYDWNRIKPVSWLIHEASDPTQPNRGDAALDELDRRFDQDLLSFDEIQQLVQAALDYQADTSKLWDDKWGKWIELSRAKSVASDEQWRRYITQASDLELITRKRISEGGRVVTTTTAKQQPFRAKFASVLFEDEASRLMPFYSEDDAKVEIRRIESDGTTGPVLVTLDSWLTPGSINHNPYDETGRAYQMTPGRYQLRAEKRYVWPDPAPHSFDGEMRTDKRTMQTTFEVFPTDHQLIKPVRDPKLAKQAESLMMKGLQKPIFGKPRIQHRSFANRFRIEVGVPGASLPCWASFDVELYVDGKRFGTTQSVTIEPNRTNDHFYNVPISFPDDWMPNASPENPPTVDQITLRLVPNPEHLKTEFDGYNYLDHVIEIKDIPVRPYRP